MDNVLLLIITYYIIAIILITVVLIIIQKISERKLKQEIEILDKAKNQIVSSPILTELSKVETLIKNEKMEEKYKNWKNELEQIKEQALPKIDDMLLDADFQIHQKDFKTLEVKIAKIEIEIRKYQSKTGILLEQIKEITLSEEQNRSLVTKFKAKYRELYQTFQRSKIDYGDVMKSIELQFENIEKRFQEFEVYMEQNDYDEVCHIVKALDEMMKHMELVIEEVPGIVLTGNNIIPAKLTEISSIYHRMTKDGYVLDYLNIEYNVKETEKKIKDILDKVKVLNLEEGIFELKTISDYLDSIFIAFDDERMARRSYESKTSDFIIKLNKTNEVINGIYLQIDELRYSYDLTKEELHSLDTINQQIQEINESSKILLEQKEKKILPYSKLASSLDHLIYQLATAEDNLEMLLQSIGNLKEDEVRAKEQLEEIRGFLRKAKYQIREYKLPIVPNYYFVELADANESIKEIVKELEKKPISIKNLNTRVDTARDLVFKLYNTTTEMTKTAHLAEMSIMYGNRYRSLQKDIEEGLTKAEKVFQLGDYKRSLELSIHAIELIEPGIYKKLLGVYGKGEK